MESRVQEAVAARQATLAHLEGMTERLAGDAFWRLLDVIGTIGAEFPWYQYSHKEWERRVRALGYIPMQRRQGAEKVAYHIVPGFRHKFWVATVQRLYKVVSGHCEDPLATTYDILTLFFPEWWPTESFQHLRDRRKEATRLRTKLRTKIA